MRRSRVPVAEKRSTDAKTKYNSSLRKTTSMGPKVTKKNFSVSMVSTRSTTENKAKEGTEEERVEPTIEIDLETPDQSVDEAVKKTTESTPMPNAEEPNPNPIEFSPIDNAEDTTGNTQETVKDESQKRTFFTERLAMMVGMRSKDAAVEETKVEKSKTFGTVSTRTTETDQNEGQRKSGPAINYRTTTDHGTTTLELSDLMAKLDQIDEKLKHSEEDRNVIKKEMRHNKHEYLDNYFHLARATEEKFQKMSDKVETTDEEREKNIRKDMQEMKQRYDAVNCQLGSLETRMDTMTREQAESSSAIQTKLDAILRNSTQPDRPASERTQGNRVDFVEPQRNKRQSTPLPATREAAITAPVGARAIIKNGTVNTTSDPGDSTTQNNVAPDAMTWANTWEMMNRTLEAFATRNTDSSDRGGNKSRKTFKKPKEFKDDSDGCIDTWVEVMRLHLEQDNLNDERQACTAILSNLEGTALKCVVAKKEEERDTADKIFEILLNRFGSGMKGHQAPDEEDTSQMEEHEFYSGLIIKIGARCFFCNQEGHFRMDCPLFWEAVKNQSHPKHTLALAAVQNQRNRQGEFETKNLERPNAELPTKTVKAVTQCNSAVEATAKNAQEIDYEKAAAEAINKVKQDLAAKEIEQRLKQEIQRQKMNEALNCSQTIPEAAEGSTKNGNCNTVKMVTGKPFGITKIGARIMSIITVGGHEVTRNLSEPSDQTLMHIDVYAEYLSCISPQTTSRALRALLTRGGSKSVRVDNRYTEAYGPHEVMLNIDGINIYTKTMITCDEDLIGQIYVGREELKVRSIGHCAMLEEDAIQRQM